jgi:hypothetical protein
MLNEIRTDREIFGSKVGTYAKKKMHVFPKVLTLKICIGKVEGQQEILCCSFFLVGIWTIELKM